MDVSAQAQQIVDQATVLENEKARLTLEQNYYSYLDDYLSSDNTDKAPISPSSMGIEDMMLTNLMQELSSLQAEYFSRSVGERNPMQSQLELRIRNTKQSIKETLVGIIQANRLALQENAQQTSRLNAEASRLPVKERQLLGFERRFNLNNELYNFLLQRRSEAQIQAASNTADNELVDPARSGKPIAPDPIIVFALVLLLGLGIPTLFMLLVDIIKNEITSDEDLSLITDLPILAYFPRSRLKYNTVVLTESSSRISEAFRSLRTRMEFIIKDIKAPLIVISSSIPGEGKTFTSINLASSYSLIGKKTLMVGFDLRRPTLAKSFELNGENGLTDYLIAKKKIDEVIYETGFDNLYVLPAGPIPPNPGELASSEKATSLFKTLKNKFDIIIVDSPPIGVVSDIYPIASMADAVIMMVRHGHSKRKILHTTLSDLVINGIKTQNLVVNDVRSSGDSYRYSYKYKYDYSKESNSK
jgi:capsular exopolysaccharide synthesis family protein